MMPSTHWTTHWLDTLCHIVTALGDQHVRLKEAAMICCHFGCKIIIPMHCLQYLINSTALIINNLFSSFPRVSCSSGTVSVTGADFLLMWFVSVTQGQTHEKTALLTECTGVRSCLTAHLSRCSCHRHATYHWHHGSALNFQRFLQYRREHLSRVSQESTNKDMQIKLLVTFNTTVFSRNPKIIVNCQRSCDQAAQSHLEFSAQVFNTKKKVFM